MTFCPSTQNEDGAGKVKRNLEHQFEIDLVRWAHVEILIQYGKENEKHNDKVVATLRTATPEMLMALLGLTSLDTAQRLVRGLERLN
jgi:glucose-6-phosphate 1-dehydrogenase